jgi:amidase
MLLWALMNLMLQRREASIYIPQGGYKKFLKIDGLKGKRIGVLNGLFHFEDRTTRQMVYRQHLYTME